MQILGIILIVVLLVFLVLLLYKEEVPVVGGRDDIFSMWTSIISIRAFSQSRLQHRIRSGTS